MVNVLPSISAGAIFLLRALPASSRTFPPIVVKLIWSVNFNTGTNNPSSTAPSIADLPRHVAGIRGSDPKARFESCQAVRKV